MLNYTVREERDLSRGHTHCMLCGDVRFMHPKTGRLRRELVLIAQRWVADENIQDGLVAETLHDVFSKERALWGTQVGGKASDPILRLERKNGEVSVCIIGDGLITSAVSDAFDGLYADEDALPPTLASVLARMTMLEHGGAVEGLGKRIDENVFWLVLTDKIREELEQWARDLHGRLTGGDDAGSESEEGGD